MTHEHLKPDEIDFEAARKMAQMHVDEKCADKLDYAYLALEARLANERAKLVEAEKEIKRMVAGGGCSQCHDHLVAAEDDATEARARLATSEAMRHEMKAAIDKRDAENSAALGDALGRLRLAEAVIAELRTALGKLISEVKRELGDSVQLEQADAALAKGAPRHE